MVHRMYSVYDSAGQVFGRPFLEVADGRAVRGFTDEVNRAEQGNPLYGHPSDFALHCIALFDDGTGVVTQNPDWNTAIIRGVDVAIREEVK